jgi:ribosomal-protein-alanine N-acetyltransferase
VDTLSGQVAGVINLNEVVRGVFQSGYLGYYAFRPFEGQGFMRAGLAQALTCTFRQLKLHRVEANIQPDNARSIALVKYLGFRLEGVSPRYLKVGRQDHQRWALLATSGAQIGAAQQAAAAERWRGARGSAAGSLRSRVACAARGDL